MKKIVLNIEWSSRFEAEGREFAKILESLEQFSEKIVLNIEWSLKFEAEEQEFATAIILGIFNKSLLKKK